MKTGLKTGLAVVIMGILLSLLFGGGADKDADIAALVKNGALVIDTRTPREYKAGHIAGAVNIPYDVIEIGIGDHPKQTPIIVYCQSGRRSSIAKKTLEQAGYTHVVNGGGLDRMRTQLQQQVLTTE